jgi:hypothetical protein
MLDRPPAAAPLQAGAAASSSFISQLIEGKVSQGWDAERVSDLKRFLSRGIEGRAAQATPGGPAAPVDSPAATPFSQLRQLLQTGKPPGDAAFPIGNGSIAPQRREGASSSRFTPYAFSQSRVAGRTQPSL